jgi:disulfide bond formation protein DsbB
MHAVMPRRARIAPLGLAFVILGAIVATIAGAFAFQAMGFAPCELCLKERLPYYAGMALAAVTLLVAWQGLRIAARVGFALLTALFLFSAAFGAYHAGVEWGFWPGPTDCTGALDHASSNADFLRQLRTVRVVRCDAVAIRILGLSLAGWNAIVSLGIAALAIAGTVGPRSGTAAADVSATPLAGRRGSP